MLVSERFTLTLSHFNGSDSPTFSYALAFVAAWHRLIRLIHAVSLKRRRSASEALVDTAPRKQPHLDTGSEFEWLHELHRCLWNRPELEEEIFCTADLTVAHWVKLQEDLSAKFPKRYNDSYVAADNVSEIKLTVLRLSPASVSSDVGSTTANLPTFLPATTSAATADTIGDQNADDDCGEDYETPDATHREFSEIECFLPTTIRYLDLSALDLSSKPERCTFPLLIRKEYETMEKIFDGGLKGRQGSVFLTGQPGIGTRFGLPYRSSDLMICTGKTSFLYVLLIKRLLRGQPTFFQTLEGNLFYVSTAVTKIKDPERELTIRDQLQDPSDVVALVDADGREEITWPCGVLMCARNIRVILASFPRDRRSRKWLKQLDVPEASYARMMDIWSESELFITA
jgi:hypothetical protein